MPATIEVLAGDTEPGRLPGGCGLPARAAGDRFPAAPWRRELSLVQTARHLESPDLRAGYSSPWTDRLLKRPGSSTLRHVPRRARAWQPGWPAPAASRSAHRSAGGEARTGFAAFEPGIPSGGRGPLRLVPATHHTPSPLWRREPTAPGRCRPAQLVGRGEPTGRRGSSGSLEGRHVVPNECAPGVRCTPAPEPFRERWGSDPFVLSVGRIERARNTLGLVQRDPTAVAAPGRHRRGGVFGYRGYAQECRSAGEGLVGLAGPARPPRRPVLLASGVYRAVFALPSWFETPGLAALEAASPAAPS